MLARVIPALADWVGGTRLRTPWRDSLRDVRWLLVAMVAMVAVGCPCVRSRVNSDPELRWYLFTNYGAQQICPQLLKTSVPLRNSPTGPTEGRFFPSSCRYDINHTARTIVVHVSGSGYGWTPVVGRVGFAADASVEYRMDFYLGEEATYIWADPLRIASGPTFRIGAVENPVIDWATRTPGSFLANAFGNQLVSSRMATGFTVIQSENGNEFAVGRISPPHHPSTPFDTGRGRKFVVGNESALVRSQQVDFMGPFEIARGGQAFFMRYRLQGPAVDGLIYSRAVADPWREGLQQGRALAPPGQAPLYRWVLQPGAEQTQRVPLPPGQYLLVVDNSAVLGAVAPPWNPLRDLGGSAVELTYVAAVGEASDVP